MRNPSILVVGAGFSGTLLSLWLQRLAPAGTRIHLVERSKCFGPGLAYRSANSNHLLNVPAGRMGAFPDLPLDFVQWLRSQPADSLAGIVPADSAFVPRHLYGAYLAHLLHAGLSHPGPATVALIQDEVVAMDDQADAVHATLASGRVLTVDLAVLATGNPPPPPLPLPISVLAAAGIRCTGAWDPDAMTNLGPNVPVLLVGTGLTMVDAVITLLDAGHSAPIHALSRHGLMPQRHSSLPAVPVALPSPLPTDVVSLARCLRLLAAQEIAAGRDWHPVVDALRPLTHDLWRRFTPADRQRFLRHLRAWWDVHRHRMAPQAADRIDSARERGQLRIHAGRIAGCRIAGGMTEVGYHPRGSDDLTLLRVGRIINCTGPATDYMRSDDALMRWLQSAGIARPDTLRQGLDVTTNGAVRSRIGVASQWLFAIGPPTKGAWWEITAVPDLRLQCRDMALMLADMLAQEPRPVGAVPAGGQRFREVAVGWNPGFRYASIRRK